jgi:hypothetical protein
VGGVTYTWIDDDDSGEPLEEGGGGMPPEANLPHSSHAWERASSWCLETMADLAHSYERTNE